MEYDQEADSIRAELLASGNPMNWRPHADAAAALPTSAGERVAAAFEDNPAKRQRAEQAALEARLRIGPGANANGYASAVADQWDKLLELQREEARLFDAISEVTGYDPDSGAPILKHTPEQQNRLAHELQAVRRQREAVEGPAGDAKLARALDEAVKVEQARRRRAYIQAEAERRAEADAREEEIAALAANIRKARGR